MRTLYLFGGLLWALVLAPMAVLAMVGIGAGIAWIFVFGDNPWPPALEGILLALGLGAGAAAAIGAIWTGYRLGLARAANADRGKEWRQGIAFCLAPVMLALLMGALYAMNTRQNQQARTAATAREAAITDLAGATKKIVGLDLSPEGQAIIHAAVRISGARQGAYRLKWRITPASSKSAIVSEVREVQIDAADADIPIDISLGALQQQYRAIVLAGRGGALIDEPFELDVTLDPVLTERESSSLLAAETRRLETPDSPLHSHSTAQFPVRFMIPQ